MKKLIITTLVLMLAVPVVMADPGDWGQGQRDDKGQRAGFDGRGPGNCDGHGPRGGRGGQFGPRGGDHLGVQRLLRNADDIGLTETQIAKLEEMTLRFQTEKIDLKADMDKAELELRALMRDENARETEVFAAIDLVTGFRGDLQKMRYQHHKEVQSVLTAEQIEKIKSVRKERMEQRQDWREEQRSNRPRNRRFGG